MKNVLFGALAAVLLAAIGVLAGTGGTRTTQAAPTQVQLMNPSLCLALIGVSGPGLNCAQDQLSQSGVGLMGFSSLTGSQTLRTVADAGGDDDGEVEPTDLEGLVTFTGRQIHQEDGVLLVLAFVDDDAPVTFETSAGLIAVNSLEEWTCTSAIGGNTGNDPDCGGGPSGDPDPNKVEDGVVVARLVCTAATCDDLGEETITVEQEGIVFPVTFTVVGEPDRVEYFSLETAIQAGVPDIADSLDPNFGDPDCPFVATVAGVTDALGQAEKTVLVARAIDREGTAITGAWVTWTTSDDEMMVSSQPVTPTLDLGAFGFGAPNILCTPIDAAAGKATVRAELSRTVQGLSLDAKADPGQALPLSAAEIEYEVHALPEKVTLTAAPASLVCDGVTTSTISAAVTAADGTPAVSGTDVNFNVQVLGTANPINATTNAEGIATSTLAPLRAGAGTGVPVVVTLPVSGVQTSILVQCVGAGAPLPGAQPGGQPAQPGGAPGGTISPPDTGSGGEVDGQGALNVWTAVALFVGALGLVGARLTLRKG